MPTMLKPNFALPAEAGATAGQLGLQRSGLQPNRATLVMPGSAPRDLPLRLHALPPEDKPASAQRMCPELLDVVRRAQSGDLAAQAELVRRYTKRISAFVRPMVGHLGAVEDVVQMIFIKLARRIGNLRDPLVYESWLFTLARNTALDFLRRSRCRPATVPEDGIFGQTPDHDSGVSVAEIMEALDFALARVSPTDRRIVTMIVHGSSYHAAAKSEGLTVGAVKLRLNRVRPFLRLTVGEAVGRQARRIETVRTAPRCRAAA